jgi:hypothetical protein
VCAWAGEGTETVPTIVMIERARALNAAVMRLEKFEVMVMVFPKSVVWFRGRSADASMSAGTVPNSKNRRKPGFLDSERKHSQS